LQFGTWFATEIGTEITLLYVEREPTLFFRKETEIAFEKLMEWNLDLPAIRIIRMTMRRLQEVDLLKMIRGKPKVVHDLMRVGEAWELHLKSPKDKDIRLKTRQGNSVEQILAENREQHSDLMIVGSEQKRGILPKIITFVDSSVLVINNLIDHRYELMIATDGTEVAHKAEYVAIKSAQYFKRKLTLMSVANSNEQRKTIDIHFERMSQIVEKRNVKYSVDIRTGDIVDNIVEAAGDKKIIFLGYSRRNLLSKYIFGSKTLKICKKANAPIFIVKKPTKYK
jgi:nucleotide-binding universal stress UspA family protein